MYILLLYIEQIVPYCKSLKERATNVGPLTILSNTCIKLSSFTVFMKKMYMYCLYYMGLLQI
jgi:hypothetical protein